MDVCVIVCMFQHNSGTPGAISTKLGTHMTLSLYICTYILYIVYINKNGCMCVCVYVCSSITLERLEQFQPNLVLI
jgi:hypothetical protein